MARTLAFQVGNTGSIPVQDAKIYATVALWEGNGLSIRLRRVRFSSVAPILLRSLLCKSKQGVCAALLMRNELGSIPNYTAKILFPSSTAVVALDC